MSVKHKAAALLCTLALASSSFALSAQVSNLTGLPAYPNLNYAVMDGVARTDTLGRWCMHFSANSSDSLERVETWYRKALAGASETDLIHDKTYRIYLNLDGIKLSVGIDSVAVYKVSNQAPTSIDLYRCSTVR